MVTLWADALTHAINTFNRRLGHVLWEDEYAPD